MNYIQQLQTDNAQLGNEIRAYELMIADLKHYLELPKFHEDTSVQKLDIVNRLQINRYIDIIENGED